jgi:ribosome biogenesis GTPase / thiamine phosphate phosphatase
VNLGLVARVDLRQAILLVPGGGEIACRMRARFMDRAKRLRGALVAGDEVEWDTDEQGTAVIEEVLPRRNLFARRATGFPAREQVVAANLDEVVVVASLARPSLREGLLDRVAVAAEGAGLPLRIVLSKADQVEPEEAARPADLYRAMGYPVHVTSAVAGLGVGELFDAIRGRRSLVVGHSGVGKSTLLNAFEPALGLRVGEVNAVTGRGRQTTTAAVLIRLADGTEVVDTPGFRAFAPYGLDAGELFRAYRDLRDLAGGCRFRDCGHASEPDCAVRAAVLAGRASRERYESYLRLREELQQEEA